jgi:hypothetical protein
MEQEIVHIALENLNQYHWNSGFLSKKDPLDGVLEMTFNGHETHLYRGGKARTKNPSIARGGRLFSPL